MFEEYTPEARRCMFFAHAAARGLGSQRIETGHILLGLARENIVLLNRLLDVNVTEDGLRAQVASEGADDGPTSATISSPLLGLPFTDESQRALASGAEEAARMSAEQVGIDHLLLGLLREPECVAARLLREHGADIARIREELDARPHQPPAREERVLRAIDEIEKVWAEVQEGLGVRRRRGDVFGRYTVKADRLIFFARYAAATLGSPVVEPEHILLSVVREETAHFTLFFPLASSNEKICRQLEEHLTAGKTADVTQRCSPREELPLSEECKRVLNYADEEAALLGSENIAPEHLLLGMLREKDSYAALVLREYGAELEHARRELAA